MAKIDVHLGFTFRVGDINTNQYSRVDVTINDVDTDLPVEEQLDKSKETIEILGNTIENYRKILFLFAF